MTYRDDDELKDRKADLLESPSRRTFLKSFGAAAAGAGLLLPQIGLGDDTEPAQGPGADAGGYREYGRAPMDVALKVNGAEKSFKIEPRTTLLEVLRDDLNLTGPKEVCSRGACGCCAVLLDGVAVNSCLMLAVDAVGREVVTVEGIAADPKHAKLIDSFCANDGAQCGFCIPGFVVGSASLLKENPSPTREQIREGLAGHICRCGTYSKMFDAVEAAGKGGAR